jgi:dipeptidyl aminopeptidase/acylaminoacyl peptidase
MSSLDAPRTRQLVAGGLAWAEHVAGKLLTARGTVIAAQRFDLERAALTPDATPIVSTSPSSPSYLFHAAGGVLAWKDYPTPLTQLEWRGRDGRRLGVFGEALRYGQIALSPGGESLAVDVVGEEGGPSIWTVNVARGVARRAIPPRALDPVWSPDGRELAYSCQSASICRQRLDGGPSARTPAIDGALWSYPESWITPDTLFFVTINRSGRTIWAQPMSGDAPPEKLVESPFALDEPQVSPDGRWLAYQSNETDRVEVYLEPFRTRGEKIRVSADGGMQPRWRGDSRELFYLSPSGDVMVAGVGGATLPVAPPRVLIGAALDVPVQDEQLDAYAVTPDGQRFLFKKAVGRPQPAQIHVLLNWPSLLAR